MTPILGIMASSRPSAVGDYESISTTVLGSTTVAVTFSSIVGTYSHLQVRFIARGASGGGILTTLNSDTAANYSYHSLTGDGATATANSGVNASNMLFVRNGGIQTAASTFSAGVIDILDYSNTSKNKTLRTLNGGDANGSGNIQLESGSWRNTAAVTSITLTHNGSGFAANSSFALYGIK